MDSSFSCLHLFLIVHWMTRLINKLYHMHMFKKSILVLVMAFSTTISSMAVFAEGASADKVVSIIEKAIVEVGKSDFSAARVQIKAARAASEALASPSDEAKRGYAFLLQGDIQAKLGDVEKSTVQLAKSLEMYKAVK